MEILKSLNLTKENEPMNLFKKDENDLAGSYSKMTNLILYLYSMHIGDPPLYTEINRVCRTMD